MTGLQEQDAHLFLLLAALPDDGEETHRVNTCTTLAA